MFSVLLSCTALCYRKERSLTTDVKTKFTEFCSTGAVNDLKRKYKICRGPFLESPGEFFPHEVVLCLLSLHSRSTVGKFWEK